MILETVVVLLCIISPVELQDNIFTFSPNASVCIGETVTLTCYVYPPAGGDFTDFALLSFNDSTPRSVAFINSPANGLTALGYSATGETSLIPVMGDSSRIYLTINSYQVSDSNTRFGCHGTFSNNGSSILVIQSQSPSIAAPPSPPPSVSVSLTFLSAASCSGSVRVAWTPGDSDRPIDTYFLFLNGDSLTSVNSPLNSYVHSSVLATGVVYRYSVIASSCAGNSAPSNEASVSVQRFSLVTTGATPLFLSYVNSSGELTLDWNLVAGNLPLLLNYSLALSYSHSQYETVDEFTESSAFSLPSNASTYSVLLTPPSFPTPDGVVTNITACIRITSQCGMAFSGEMLCGNINSENPPTTTQPTQPTIAPTTNELTSTSPILSTTISSTNATDVPTQAPLPIAAIAGAVGAGVAVLLIIIIILAIVLLCTCCAILSKKRSPFAPTQIPNIHMKPPASQKPNPEYIDMSTLASQSPKSHKPISTERGHYYTHMASVSPAQMTVPSLYENTPH